MTFKKQTEQITKYAITFTASGVCGYLFGNLAIDAGFRELNPTQWAEAFAMTIGLLKIRRDEFPNDKMSFGSIANHRSIAFGSVISAITPSRVDKSTKATKHITIADNPRYHLKRGHQTLYVWDETELKQIFNTMWRRHYLGKKPGGLTRTYWTKHAGMMRAEYDYLIQFMIGNDLIVGRGKGRATGRPIGNAEKCLDILRENYGHN